jgi:hypothetical protein
MVRYRPEPIIGKTSMDNKKKSKYRREYPAPVPSDRGGSNPDDGKHSGRNTGNGNEGY